MRKKELKMVECISIFTLDLLLEYLALATNYTRKEIFIRIYIANVLDLIP